MIERIRRTTRISLFFRLILLVIVTMILDCQLRYPNTITLFEGEQLPIQSASVYSIDTPAGTNGVLTHTGQLIADNYNRHVTLSQTGDYAMTVKLFGLIPVRSVTVNVEPKRTLAACGNAVGIKIFTKGLVCVGTQEIKGKDGHSRNISREADIRTGDIIISANGHELTETKQLIDLIAENGHQSVNLIILRNNQTFTKSITPIETQEGFRLGIWLRDSTAGIGTLTFYDPQSLHFGALGHPITDTDTGALMPVSEGSLLRARVFSVQKGEKGEPGELKGVFKTQEPDLGVIIKNSEQGVYGQLTEPPATEYYPVASGNQVKEGKAYILSNITQEQVERFEIEIQKTFPFYTDENKNMIIHVTDPTLLARTGGIVQGMSGSPIIQDGKIIGAVTHVFVNDPTRGYGIFIEKMLENVS